jgi:3-deoxy-D-manno-octulosonic-acid transferase
LLASISLSVYGRLVAIVVWAVLVPFTLAQIARHAATFAELRERLGRVVLPPPRGVRIVVHAVSAGEMAAAGAFIQRLQAERPEWTVVATAGTRDGRAVANRLRTRLPTIEAVIGLPWDRRGAIERWLGGLACCGVVIVEPEIWPSLYEACGRKRVPLLLVNGHVYPRDVARYRLARWLFTHVLQRPAWIGVQSAAERDRFRAIGALDHRVSIAGSLKLDAAAEAWTSALAHLVRAVEPRGRTLIGGSTYALEESALLDGLERLRSRVGPTRLILAPRHVERATEVLTAAASRGFRAMSASALSASPQPWDVLVLDRLGELAALYAAADVAFVGGSMVPRGGHNVLEPAARGVAVVVGPHTEHIREVVDDLAAAGGIVRMRDAEAATLVETVETLFSDDCWRNSLGTRAREHCLGRTGAAAQSVAALIACVEREKSAVSARGLPRVPQETWRRDASGRASSGGVATPRQGW